MQEPDESLLQSFAARRDEKTFRALTARYLGLIFHTAMRRTGNRQLAEEVSQNVLCALARKAGDLSRHPERLGPWLHRATVFESLKAMRSESSHQRRKQLVHPDDIPDTHNGESVWASALPVLDESLDKLPETDRTVLLLHFYESRSFPQIARSLGKSAEAVQKQSRRALEKLSRLLRSKGVILPAGVLVSCLSAEMAKASPLPAASSAAAALADASATPGTSLHLLFGKPKLVVSAVVVACAIPLAIQQSAISDVRARNSELLAGRGASAPAGGTTTASRSDRSAAGISRNYDFFVLADELDEALRTDTNVMDQPNVAAFRKKLGMLDDAALIRLIREGTGLTLEGSKKRGTLQALVAELARRGPKQALDAAVGAFSASPSFDSLVTATRLGTVLADWAGDDPEAAWSWMKGQQEQGRFMLLPMEEDYPRKGDAVLSSIGNVSGFMNSASASMQMPLLRMLIGMDSSFAREMVGAVPEGARAGYLMNAIPNTEFPSLQQGSRLLEKSGEQAGWGLRFMGICREFLTKPEQEEMLRRLLPGRNYALMLPEAGLREFFNKAGLDEAERMIAARYFAESLSAVHGESEPARQQREGMKRWIDELAPGGSEGLVGDARAKDEQANSEFWKRRLEALRNKPQVMDEELVSVLSRPGLKDHLPAALEQAQRIKDPARRAKVIEHLKSSTSSGQ